MKNILALLAVVLLFVGCATTTDRVLDVGEQSQLQKRSYQSRTFDTADKEKVMRAVLSTLQDLAFVIDRADFTLGSISGTKFGQVQVKITVSVRPRGSDRMLVRANAQADVRPIEDPKAYQDFFTSLEKSLFLTAHTGE